MDTDEALMNPSRRLRILVVASWYPDVDHEARGIFIERDAQLISQSHDIHVVHLEDANEGGAIRESVYNDLRITTLPLSRTNVFSILKVGLRLARLSRGYDLVHSMAFTALLPLSIARLFKSFTWVHTEHFSALLEVDQSKTSRALKALKHLLSRPHHVIAVSETLAHAIRQYRKRKRTSVIPNLVPVEVNPRPREVAANLRLVFIGHLIERKDPLLAVSTVSLLNDRGIPTVLTVVGKGELQSQVERLIHDLGLEERVHLIGEVQPADIPRVIGSHDMLFVPTRNETFFLACAEGLGAGRPVVVGANGAHAEYVRRPAGWLVATQTPEAYADAIQEAIGASASLSAQEISADVRSKYGPQAIWPQVQTVYDQVLNSSGKLPVIRAD